MKKFTRTIEDFTCEKCGTHVSGNGYTNHCPKCLWSKHVDVNPGDRAGECGGLMEPVAVFKKGREFILMHRCGVCGFERKNKLGKDDMFDSVLKLNRE